MEEVCSRGVIVKSGRPPAKYDLHRERIISLFCNYEHADEKRVLLTLLPNGDWTGSIIVLYVGGSKIKQEAAVNIVCNGIVTAVGGSNFPVLKETRWEGATVCIDRAGILEAMLGLGAPVYRRYLCLKGCKRHSFAAK